MHGSGADQDVYGIEQNEHATNRLGKRRNRRSRQVLLPLLLHVFSDVLHRAAAPAPSCISKSRARGLCIQLWHPTVDDISLRDPRNQTFRTALAHLAGMTSIFIEKVARCHPGKIALSHYYLGCVPTGVASNSNFPLWLKTLLWVVEPQFRFF